MRAGSGCARSATPCRTRAAWRAGFGYEFLERADGFPGLSRAYGLQFAEAPRVMDLSLTYRAVATRQVDMIAGDATAGLIAALDLVMLEDDRHYFPPYDAVPVVHAATLLREPRVRTALDRLAGHIREADMRAMNYAVEGEKQRPGRRGAALPRRRWSLRRGRDAGDLPGQSVILTGELSSVTCVRTASARARWQS